MSKLLSSEKKHEYLKDEIERLISEHGDDPVAINYYFADFAKKSPYFLSDAMISFYIDYIKKRIKENKLIKILNEAPSPKSLIPSPKKYIGKSLGPPKAISMSDIYGKDEKDNYGKYYVPLSDEELHKQFDELDFDFKFRRSSCKSYKSRKNKLKAKKSRRVSRRVRKSFKSKSKRKLRY